MNRARAVELAELRRQEMIRRMRMSYASDSAVVQARYRFEMDAEVAEHRMDHEGIKPELLAYVRGLMGMVT